MIERYLLSEIIPHFLNALVILCSILIVSQLVRLSEMLVALGISVENLVLPVLYIIFPFLAFMIPIAFLAGVMIGLSRLSADGEYPALLAAGYSLSRIAKIVIPLALVLYVISAFMSSYLEAWGRRELTSFYHRKTQTELDNIIKYKIQAGVFLEDFLGFTFYAERINEERNKFENVMLTPKGSGDKNYLLFAPFAELTGSVGEANLRMVFKQAVIKTDTVPPKMESSVIKFQEADLDLVRIFSTRLLGGDELSYDYRSFPPDELAKTISAMKQDPKRDDSTYYRARYLFHQRIAGPFAAVTFALFALVLGVSDPRRGKNMSYLYAIVAIILGYVFMMGFKWFAEKGTIPAPLAAWLPNLILSLFGGFLVAQKNRLPPSESPLDVRFFPKFFRAEKRRPHR